MQDGRDGCNWISQEGERVKVEAVPTFLRSTFVLKKKRGLMVIKKEYMNDMDIVQSLKKRKSLIESYFNERMTLSEILKNPGVGGNTFRRFAHMPEKPSEVYRAWASKFSSDARYLKYVDELFCINSNEDYDKWIAKLSMSLNRFWYRHMGLEMDYAPRRKLPNLFLKKLVLWDKLKSPTRNRLIRYLHIPWDKYTLSGIRHCVEDRIPKNATMGFVDNIKIYNTLHQTIRRIANKAGVPPIYYDVLLWDLNHRNNK